MSTLELSNKTILIEIPAYCDEQLIATVKSAIVQADNPNRIHFAICYQNNDMSDYDILSKMENMSIIKVPLSQAKGACYARHLCQTLLKNEDYVLHIDAHMRFVKHWDTEMINQLESYNDTKAVISVYPKSIKEEQLKLQLDDPFFDEPPNGLIQYCKHFTADMNHLKFCCRSFCKNDEQPKKNIWVAGGFLFAYRNFDIEIPFDPLMPHVQDEHSVSLRAFTKGFTVYNSDKLYIYHWYHRSTRKMPKKKKTNECERLNKLYRIGNEEVDLGEYDIGNIRTIEEFENISGVYFKEKKILKHCQAGLYFEKDIPDELFSITESSKNDFNDYEAIRNSKINLIIVGKNIEDTKECIINALKTSKYEHLINVTVVLPIKYKKECNIENADIIFVENKTKYSGYLASVDFEKFKDDEFCLCIDSDIRFADVFRNTCWDEYYKGNLLELGEDTIISGFVKVCNDNFKTAYNKSNIVIKREGTKFIYKNGKDFNEKSTKVEQLLRDGFMFCKSKVLKNIKIDPNLLCSEHTTVYSARLFTHGYDIYYLPIMYANRKADISTLDEIGNKNTNQAVVGHFFGLLLPNCLLIPSNYEYGIGEKRRIKRWLELINFNYTKNEPLIKE